MKVTGITDNTPTPNSVVDEEVVGPYLFLQSFGPGFVCSSAI